MPTERVPTERVRTENIAELHAAIDVQARRLHVLHAERLHCKRGCSACCVDDLTVSRAEAEHLRAHYAELLATLAPHAIGACAFLDADGACRVYAHRPYVCRTQGLPLRWLEEGEDGDESVTELRDICPLNEEGTPIEELPADACWTLGPFEERLAALQVAMPSTAAGAEPARVSLRELFAANPRT